MSTTPSGAVTARAFAPPLLRKYTPAKAYVGSLMGTCCPMVWMATVRGGGCWACTAPSVPNTTIAMSTPCSFIQSPKKNAGRQAALGGSEVNQTGSTDSDQVEL